MAEHKKTLQCHKCDAEGGHKLITRQYSAHMLALTKMIISRYNTIPHNIQKTHTHTHYMPSHPSPNVLATTPTPTWMMDASSADAATAKPTRPYVAHIHTPPAEPPQSTHTRT